MCRVVTEDEESINDNIHDYLLSLGNTVASNKKLYYFTGLDVFAWATMTKDVGLWIYKATGNLRKNLPVLIDFKFHNTVKYHGAHTKMADIIER